MTEVTARSIELRTLGDASRLLRDDEVRAFVEQSLAGVALDGRRVCVVVPDATRSCPLPLLLARVHSALAGRVSRVTVLVALGTHAADGRGAPGLPPRLPAQGRWPRPIPGMTCSTTNGGTRRPSSRSARSRPTGSTSCPRAGCDGAVDVRLNRRGRRARRRAGRRAGVPARGGRLLRRQQVLLPRCRRPGGHRPLALAGRPDHQRGHHRHPRDHPGPGADRRGGRDDPGRDGSRCAWSRSPAPSALHAASFGDAAGGVGGRRRGVRADPRPVPGRAGAAGAVGDTRRSTTTCGPRAKGFYKVEPVVADGGEVILYAPHITEISAMHPEIDEIGYHCRDYFVKQWDRFRHLPLGRARALHPPARRGHLRRRARRALPGHRHAGHRHPGGRGPGRQPRLPRPGTGRPRRHSPRIRRPWSWRRPVRCCFRLR